AGAIATKGVLETAHGKDIGDRLGTRDPGMERGQRCDCRLERIDAPKNLELAILRKDCQQATKRSVVAGEAGEEAVRKNPARRRDPRAFGKRLSLPDPVVPRVIEDVAVTGLECRWRRSDLREPVRRGAGAPQRVDDEVCAELSWLGARALDSPGTAEETDDARVLQDLDPPLREHGLAEGPLDQRPPDAEVDEVLVARARRTGEPQ